MRLIHFLAASLLVNAVVAEMAGKQLRTSRERMPIRVDLIREEGRRFRDLPRPPLIEEEIEEREIPRYRAEPVARRIRPDRPEGPDFPKISSLDRDLVRIWDEESSRSGHTAVTGIMDPGSGIDAEAALIVYRQRLRERIRAGRIYPARARHQGITGSVTLRFELDREGRLLSCRVLKSSGYAVLDEAAKETIRASAPFPPLPPALKRQSLWIEVPIQYEMY